MKIKIAKNKYLNALFVLMLFSAIVHMIILFWAAFRAGSIYVLNYFNILDFDYFFPELFNNFWGNAMSFLAAGAIFLAALKINKPE